MTFTGGGLLALNRTRIHAVDGVSFDVHPGETFGLVGESGSGKTTTGRAILRLVDATAGSIRFDGTEVTAMGRRTPLSYRRDVQVVFQDPWSSLNARKVIGEILAEPLWEAMTPISRDVFAYKTHAATPEEARRAARSMSLDGVLQRLDRPARFVTGDQDRLVPWEQTQAQAKAAPRGEFVLFQGGGHVVSNYPHRFRSLTADWLREQLS